LLALLTDALVEVLDQHGWEVRELTLEVLGLLELAKLVEINSKQQRGK
jgi:hypothetical protein